MGLYVREAGPADAPTLLFLHGLGLSSVMWQPQLELLSDFHCLAPDLPEHGNSTDSGILTLENCSHLLSTLIRQRFPNQRVHIVGLSMGGAIAVRLLCDVPELIHTVLVSGAATRLNRVLASLNALNAPIIRMLTPQQLAILMAKQFNIPPRYQAMLAEDMKSVKPSAITHYSHELTRIELPVHVAVPVLVMCGQKENFIAKASAREMCKTLPAQGRMAPNVGHVWNLEAPELFANTVRAWVKGEALPGKLLPL